MSTSIKAHIHTLQTFLDNNKNLTEDQKAAIQAGITAIKKDQILEALKLLVPLIGPIAQSLIGK